MHASASQLALVLLLIGWKGGANLLSQSHRVESAKPITFRHSNENRFKRWIHAASNFTVQIPSRSIRQMMPTFLLELNSKRLYRRSRKEKQSRSLVFTLSIKREIRHFHVVVVQWRQRNVQKSVMHVQSCCFAYLNLLLCCRSRWRRRRRCLSSLTIVCNRSSKDKHLNELTTPR